MSTTILQSGFLLLFHRYKYFDPPERSQGTSDAIQGKANGVIGLIWKRVSIIIEYVPLFQKENATSTTFDAI